MSPLGKLIAVRRRFGSWRAVIGFGLAMLLNRSIPAKGLITTLLLLPMMLSMAVVGLFWKLLYDPNFGIINYFLGLDKFEWLADPDVALYAIAIVDIWMWAPFVMLLSLAGLSAVPKHLYEAAEIDRASGIYTFFRITLPLVAPILCPFCRSSTASTASSGLPISPKGK